MSFITYRNQLSNFVLHNTSQHNNNIFIYDIIGRIYKRIPMYYLPYQVTAQSELI